MAVTELGQTQTFIAARDLSSYQYCPVYISTDNTVDYVGAAGKVNGILQNKPHVVGAAAEVITASGVKSKLKVDATTDIDAGDPLECNGSHVGIKLTIDGNGTTETYLIGWAVTEATESSAYITVLTDFVPTSK